MQPDGAHSGDLSQDSATRPVHPTGVKLERSVDPATKAGRSFYQALSASSVGLEFGISVAIGLLVGVWLDGELGTKPWLMLAMLAIGFTAGFRGILRAVDRSDRWAKAEDTASPGLQGRAAPPKGGA